MRLVMPVFTAVLVAVTGLVGGCTRSSDGVARADPAHVRQTVPAQQLSTILLTPSQLADAVGSPVKPRVEMNQPVPGDAGGTQCASLDTAGTRGFVGDGFSAFQLVVSADGTGSTNNHVVAQAASIYPAATAATKAFATATSDLSSCNGRQVRGPASWRFAIRDVTADTARWSKQQTDIAQQWLCYAQARVRNNVVIEAMACQGDNGGEAKADTILNDMSASVWEVSGR
jgi:hypothetical protein